MVVGFACMLWILRSGSPEVRLAYHVFYLLLCSVLVAVPIELQPLAAAMVIWAAGIGNLWVRALVGAVTAGLGALLYASPGDGTPQFVIITVGSAIGAGLQSMRSVKPADPTAD
ncbi:hypothetical protein [Symbiobacterium terraclitae]|uniref:hypothetical protein n=1 Tax=Symbiobacterium terraclitae TaxID=557451 RepID=UPI0035B54FA8